jgi:hypothetical protein
MQQACPHQAEREIGHSLPETPAGMSIAMPPQVVVMYAAVAAVALSQFLGTVAATTCQQAYNQNAAHCPHTYAHFLFAAFVDTVATHLYSIIQVAYSLVLVATV